jgi:hypothetical protein
MFNAFLSSVKPGLKLKTPSFNGWGFWFNTKLDLFIGMLFVVCLSSLYMSKVVINCHPIKDSTAWKDFVDGQCLQKLTRTSEYTKEVPITFGAIGLSMLAEVIPVITYTVVVSMYTNFVFSDPSEHVYLVCLARH